MTKHTAALDRKELKGAFDLLLGLIAGSGHYEFQDKLDELQGTYKAMLGYQMMNVSDPMQSQIYRQLQAALYELADRIRIRALEKDSPRQYFSMLRMRRMHSDASFRNLHRDLAATYDSLSPNAAEEWQKAQENRALTLFRKLWISAQLDVEEVVALRELLADERVPAGARCLAVSALWLSLQEIFDKEKVGLLCDAVAVANAEVHARALVSLLLTLYFYRKRTALYPQIEHRLQALAESLPGFSKEIQTIIMRFILSRETEKISRRLRDEIIPEMVKLGPKLSQKINLKDLTPEQLSDEMNPEWQEKLLADSDLGKKVMEFSELQQEGADIMHSTFVHLKNYPFFRELGNWFLLFDGKHSALAGMQPGDSVVAINGLATPTFYDASEQLTLHKGQDVTIDFYRNGALQSLTMRTDSLGKIGVAVKLPTELYQTVTRKYNFFESFPAGIELGVNTLKGYVNDMKYVFTKEGASSLGGFGTIGGLFPSVWDWRIFWERTAFLSIILAFMNILPIPALDGGHVMFLLYEVIARRKPSDKFLEYAQITGMAILFALLIYANGNDLFRFLVK